MRKLALLLLLPSLALAQGLSLTAPGVTGGGKVLASFPLTTSGALIEEDANTVAHVYWNGTALVDTKGNSWTQNGTVPQVTANPFTTTRYGAGPFSAANYYSLGTGADVLDFAGDFTICVVLKFDATDGAWRPVVYNGVTVTSGWELWVNASSNIIQAVFITDGGAADTRSTVMLTGTTGPNSNFPLVICGGRSGTTQYAKINLGTTVSTPNAKNVPGTAAIARIGVDNTLVYSARDTLYEVYATSTAWSEATVTAIQQKVLGHYDGSAPLAVTRTTNATYIPRDADCASGPCLYTASPGMARITTDGLLVEPIRANYALQSNTISTATDATWPWGRFNATVATVAGAPMGGTWAEVTTSVNDGSTYQNVSGIASSTTFVSSAWLAKASGTGYAGVATIHNGLTISACTCVRSDGGSCTATIYNNGTSSARCHGEVSDLGTPPLRLSTQSTVTVAATSAQIGLSPGRFGVATGTTRFTGAQVEVGTYPTSLIVTTTTATARNADAVSATVPAVPSKWCVAGNFAPATGTWGDAGSGGGGLMWTIGTTYNAANTASSWTNHSLWVFDSSAAAKDLGAFPSTPASPWRFVTCNSLGSLSLTVNGLVVDTTATGAGTGVLTTPSTTLLLGHRSGSAGYEFGGFIKNLKICSAKNAKECK